MTAEIPAAAGPPCDFTPEYAAIMSVMNLADYSQVKVCAQCAPEYLSAIVTALTGGMPDSGDAAGVAAGPDQSQPDGMADTDECPLCGDMVPLADIPAHVGGHSDGTLPVVQDVAILAVPKPDPGTANVVRSTHGHRKPRGAAAAAPPAGYTE